MKESTVSAEYNQKRSDYARATALSYAQNLRAPGSSTTADALVNDAKVIESYLLGAEPTKSEDK